MSASVDWCAKALSGAVICNIGQLEAQDKRALDKLVKRGDIAKWQGYWYPVSGANFGIGPLKTCYGLERVRIVVQFDETTS